ncbi:hypothetical protein [Streptomyces cirratus]|uniref:hypothetical protein n=1 Tax=Streptomyces cirratus TaxID=68187 RepID=UPI003617326E
MVDPLVLHLGEGVAGDEAAHAEAADGEPVVALTLVAGAHDRFDRGVRVLLDGGAALVEAEDDDIVAAAAQLAEEGVLPQSRPCHSMSMLLDPMLKPSAAITGLVSRSLPSA